MKVLVTGHQGYIGSVMVADAAAGGPRCHRLSTANLYQRCTYAPAGSHAAVPSIRKDVRDVDRRGPRGLRRGHPSCGAVERPARQSRPGHHLRHQPSRQRPHGQGGQGRWRLALPVRFLVQQLRPVRRGHDRRDRRPQSGHRLWLVEGAVRSRTSRSWPDGSFSPDLSCARRPPTACRRGCASTSSSTTSWPGRSPRASSC